MGLERIDQPWFATVMCGYSFGSSIVTLANPMAALQIAPKMPGLTDPF